jgi:hypothetical protein
MAAIAGNWEMTVMGMQVIWEIKEEDGGWAVYSTAGGQTIKFDNTRVDGDILVAAFTAMGMTSGVRVTYDPATDSLSGVTTSSFGDNPVTATRVKA